MAHIFFAQEVRFKKSALNILPYFKALSIKNIGVLEPLRYEMFASH